MDTTTYINAFFGLLAVLNPLGNLPLYIAATQGLPSKASRILSLYIWLIILAFLLVFTVLGQSILDFFGISLSAFRIAGGIVVLHMGLEMIQGRAHGDRFLDKAEDTDESPTTLAKSWLGHIMVPIAVPIFVGPGSISAVIVYGHGGSLLHLFVIGGVVFATTLVVLVCLLMAETVQKLLGKHGIDIATRLLGLVLAAIAIQFIIDGLKGTGIFS